MMIIYRTKTSHSGKIGSETRNSNGLNARIRRKPKVLRNLVANMLKKRLHCMTAHQIENQLSDINDEMRPQFNVHQKKSLK